MNVNKLKKINLNSYSNFLVKKSFKDINIKVLYKIFTNTEINKVLFYSKTIVGGSSNSFLAAFMKAFFKNHYKIDISRIDNII